MAAKYIPIKIATMILCISSYIAAEISVSANLFLGRAFSANIARELLMTRPYNQDNEKNIFFALDAVHQKSWNQGNDQGIGIYPFWSQTNSMTVGDNNGTYHIDAYQFGLGPITPTSTSISLNPTIYQNGSDFMLYGQSKKYGHAFFGKIKSALTAMVMQPNFTETNPATPVLYPAGALSVTTSTVADPSSSMSQAFAGNTGTQSGQGDFRPMTNGLINGKQSTGAHLSDIEMTLGYNYSCPDTANNIQFAARITAPTGIKPQGIYILEPINGRGGNWGVGFYLAGSYRPWTSQDEHRTLTINFMSDGIHLCNANVMRSYDLTANDHGSKYLLVADYQNNVYQNSIQNLVNLSTLTSQSSFAFEGDAALSLSFSCHNFSIDVGYNAWGRTQEKLEIVQDFQQARYAVLGRQAVGYYSAGAEYPVNACQPLATINLSNSAVATTPPSATVVTNQTSVVNATVAANRISGNDAFNTAITAQYAAVTSKLFTKLGYTWNNCNCAPYLHATGEIEWSNISNNALPQWGIGLIFGVSL
ncbi:MAG: hypothetical protein ACXWL2_04495 [Candidatus Chromulinivorax sp.]